jgi:ABC-type nickel/cobalt efflux system permease component RcnA
MHWLQFIAYFLIALVFFAAVWKGLDKAFNAFEDRQDRRFEEKVDRYRR